MLAASRSMATRRLTTTVRESAMLMGPSWAAATQIFRLMTLFSWFERSIPCGKLRHFGDLPAQRLERIGRLAGEEMAAASFGRKLAVFDDDIAARKHCH